MKNTTMKDTCATPCADAAFPSDPTTATVLRAAFEAWSAGASMRGCRERLKRYTYGRQWDDMTIDSQGNPCSEYELAVRSGHRPLTNNLMRRLVKTVVGRFREAYPQADGVLQPLYRANALRELDSRAFEEFVISGCAVQRIVRERRMRGDGVWVDNVDPSRFFVSGMRDPRGWDAELVGMLHDMTLSEVIMRFAGGDRRRAAALRAMLLSEASPGVTVTPLGGDEGMETQFYHAPQGRCRLVEVWTLDSEERVVCHDRSTGRVYAVPVSDAQAVEAESRRRLGEGMPPIDTRWEMGARWMCRWITPSGRLLARFPSPWPHGEHPFVLKLYPLTDGEIHPFIEDVVDQQRYVNRLITLIDNIMGSSAKGVLLFPDDQLSPLTRWEDVAQRWASTDGVIPYRAKGDQKPTQIYSHNNDVGAYNLLSLEMRLFDEVSGVGGALQGKEISGTMSASLYEQQVRNSSVALTDLFESFACFRSDRDAKLIAVAPDGHRANSQA